MAEEPRRSVQPDASKVSDVVASHVQADWSAQQRQSLLGGDQEKQESPLPIASCDQQQHPPPRQWRLPLPKLKTLVKSKSNSEQGVENTLVANIEGTSSQMQQRKDFTLSTSSYNSALSTQAENLISSSSGVPSPCVAETKSDHG